MMSSWTSVAVWMNSTTAAFRIARGPGVAAQPRRHQQHRRAHALAAALQKVVADLGNDVDLRLDLPRKLALDRFEIGADGLEQLNQIRLGPGCGVRHARQSHHTDRRGVNATEAR